MNRFLTLMQVFAEHNSPLLASFTFRYWATFLSNEFIRKVWPYILHNVKTLRLTTVVSFFIAATILYPSAATYFGCLLQATPQASMESQRREHPNQHADFFRGWDQGIVWVPCCGLWRQNGLRRIREHLQKQGPGNCPIRYNSTGK